MAAEGTFCTKVSSVWREELQWTLLTGALFVFSTQWQDVATMAAPIGPHIGKIFKSVRNTMVELLLVGVGLCVRFTDTFRDDLGVAFFVARVLAILALHAGGIL